SLSLLDESVDHYRQVQVLMGRTLGSIVVNSDLANSAILSEWGGGDDSASEVQLSDAARNQLAQVEARLVQAHEAIEHCRRSAKAHLTASLQIGQVARVDQAFAGLLDEALPPVLDQLKTGHVEEYEQLQSGRVEPAERLFEDVVQTLKQYQQQQTAQAIHDEDAHLQLVVVIVGVSMVVALLFAVAAYLFLQRVVLRPLRQAGRHFDRIAAGDLTEPIHVPSRNEIGVLYLAMQRMQDSLVRMVT